MNKKIKEELVSGFASLALFFNTLETPMQKRSKTLTEAEIQQYINSSKATIYTSLACNVVLQEMFAEQISKPEIKRLYDTKIQEVLKESPSIFRRIKDGLN